MSAQGHGDTHSLVVGLSSVSSEKQIQHFRGSEGGAEDEGGEVASSVALGEAVLGEEDLGVLISRV